MGLAAALLCAQTITTSVTLISNEWPIFTPPNWTLTHTPKYLLSCFRNGLYQMPGIDFDLKGNVITTPYWSPRDIIACNYGY